MYDRNWVADVVNCRIDAVLYISILPARAQDVQKGVHVKGHIMYGTLCEDYKCLRVRCIG